MKHVHAELMALYAQDAMETDKPWERWESCFGCLDKWKVLTYNPSWSKEVKYRRKPCTIKVNGFDVPEPMRATTAFGVQYWLAKPSTTDFALAFRWHNNSVDRLWLSRGLIHSTEAAAAKHAMAMCGIDPATYKE